MRTGFVPVTSASEPVRVTEVDIEGTREDRDRERERFAPTHRR